MSFTYDPATDVGRIRLLTSDKDEDNPIFMDEELEAFLSINGNDMLLAAADALDALASNEAYVQKVITIMDLSTNGPATAKALREHASSLRERVANQEVVVDIVQMGVNPSSQAHIWLKDELS